MKVKSEVKMGVKRYAQDECETVDSRQYNSSLLNYRPL